MTTRTGYDGVHRRAPGACRAIAAPPSVDPGRSDAALCLFMHSLAIRTMRFPSSWPQSVATRLGIPATEVTE
jgi:hypothetical protein